jgi:hypothetical protein
VKLDLAGAGGSGSKSPMVKTSTAELRSVSVHIFRKQLARWRTVTGSRPVIARSCRLGQSYLELFVLSDLNLAFIYALVVLHTS